MKRSSRFRRLALAVVAIGLLGVAFVFWFGLREDRANGNASPLAQVKLGSDITARGHYLVTAGGCMACHTVPGGTPYAGGRDVPTPFGTFYSPNITPDMATGIGAWNPDDFWRALHNGKSKDGKLLYPSFPYTNYTKLQRADTDAMLAYLKTLPPAHQPNRKHALIFPFNLRFMLIGWRALFFRPGEFEPDANKPESWNRGAYLVEGLVHCSACHEARNALGGVQARRNPAGGLVLSWYAPALTSAAEAGLQHWQEDDIVKLLKTGGGGGTAVLGPMAEVVYETTQHLADGDLLAMASYLKSFPETEAPAASGGPRVPKAQIDIHRSRGRAVYEEHCSQCHGQSGEGRGPAAPALAGNRIVNLGSAVDPIRIVLFGGYPPGTEGNPRPYGMPPFGVQLANDDIAAVLSYIRGAWGNRARPVSETEVQNNSGSPLW